MNMLTDTLLNRPTAKAVKRKDNKTSLRSSFVALIALRYLFTKKTSNASEARGVAILLVLVSA